MTNSLLRNQKEIIRELFETENSIGIILGRQQNTDTVAAALGLYLLLLSSGKNVQIVSKRDPNVEVSSLFGVDRISRSFEGDTKILTISVPYREGEIEKVSYNIDGNRLKVNLFAESSGISFTEKDVEYIRNGSTPSLIITVGVQSDEELSSFVDPKTVKTIHIDRNPLNSLMGDVAIIDPSFSSVSEIIASLVMELALGPDADAFQNLMDGITYATRNFTLPTTSPFAFEAAGFLLQNGARRKEREARREERDRNFPKEDFFLKQKQGRDQSNQGSSRNQNRQNRKWQAQGSQSSQNPQNTLNLSKNVQQIDSLDEEEAGGMPSLPQDDLSSDINQPNINKAGNETENAMPDEIPDDWFLPKVFKGSRKGN